MRRPGKSNATFAPGSKVRQPSIPGHPPNDAFSRSAHCSTISLNSTIRLKGGDPTIFGRLAEEIQVVRDAGIGFEVIPGIGAAPAAAARLGVSLTERGRASMVILATASDHASRGVAPLDWELLSRAKATIAFYMPVRVLGTVTASLTAVGRDPREPAVIVERLGMDGERVTAAPLGDVAARARAATVASPALLLVGPALAAASVPVGVRRIETLAEA
jgi:siroheme synthase